MERKAWEIERRFRTEPIWNALGEQPGCPDVPVFRENVAAVIGERAQQCSFFRNRNPQCTASQRLFFSTDGLRLLLVSDKFKIILLQ